MFLVHTRLGFSVRVMTKRSLALVRVVVRVTVIAGDQLGCS